MRWKTVWFMIIYIVQYLETTSRDHQASRDKRDWIETLCKSFSISATRRTTQVITVEIQFDDTCTNVPPSAFPVRFFFTLSSKEDNTYQIYKHANTYMTPLYCSCKMNICTNTYEDIKLNNTIYFLWVEPKCSGYGPGLNACNVCSPIKLILPLIGTTAHPTVKTTIETQTQYEVSATSWLIIIAIAGPSCMILILVILMIFLCKTSSSKQQQGNQPQLYDDVMVEVPLNRKRILVISHSVIYYNQTENLLNILRKFDDLNIINIEDCLGEIQSNYHNWVQNEVLMCDVVVLVLSHDLLDIVLCDSKDIAEQFSDNVLAPVIFELVNFCQAVNVPKYVTSFDCDLDYTDVFFGKYPSFDTGAMFNLSKLNEDGQMTFLNTIPDLFHLLSAIYSNIIQEKFEADSYICQTLDSIGDFELQPLHTEV